MLQLLVMLLDHVDREEIGQIWILMGGRDDDGKLLVFLFRLENVQAERVHGVTLNVTSRKQGSPEQFDSLCDFLVDGSKHAVPLLRRQVIGRIK